jgi:sulfoquinovose isomerase
MHLTVALMSAFEVIRDSNYLHMAERIADLIIGRDAAENHWRITEHFGSDWRVNRDYAGSPMFRPYGTTPGHSLEWSRLLLQLWELGGSKLRLAMLFCEITIRAQAVSDGWDKDFRGFYYTLDWDGKPAIRDRYWWPCCEGIGAAAFLNAIDGATVYEEWYRWIWGFVAIRFTDRDNGGWRAQVNEALQPSSDPFFGESRHLSFIAGVSRSSALHERERNKWSHGDLHNSLTVFPGEFNTRAGNATRFVRRFLIGCSEDRWVGVFQIGSARRP